MNTQNPIKENLLNTQNPIKENLAKRKFPPAARPGGGFIGLGFGARVV